jgi:D-threo-aldose 1-dehydrogenase
MLPCGRKGRHCRRGTLVGRTLSERRRDVPYPRYAYQEAEAEVVARAREIAAICDRHGVPLAAAALQFSLRDPRITSTIVGMSKPGRVEDTIALARHDIPDALWEELAEVPFDMTEPQ